ncbi:MAG: VanW family protein [Lachnospiraceae bacterium]|nr:VanW family protein [Lachnospiraceae bacterium]
MFKKWKLIIYLVLSIVIICGTDRAAYAKDKDDTILEGIYVESVDLAGMTASEATAAVEGFIEELKTKSVTLSAVENQQVVVTIGDLGVSWTNRGIIDDAAALGKEGNIVQRYKSIQDLKYKNVIYELELDFDKDAIRTVISEKGTKYDIPAVNASLTLVDGEFQYTDGQNGTAVNVEESVEKVYAYLLDSWNQQDMAIDLVLTETLAKGSAEELSQVKDLLGSYSTTYSAANIARSKNVENGCRLVNGTTLYPGEEFSTLEALTPFTENNGYYAAASYLNGKVVDSLGGGICQVSTTLYNAVLLSELETTLRSSHSMIVSYVEPSMDAAIAESSGKDFKFRNNTDYPIYIEGHANKGKIVFNIYGKETRDPGHKVRFESEVLETTYPDHEDIKADSSQPVGYINIESAHIGYKARLWKIIEEDGVEVSRDIINRSTYKVSPRSAVVGTASSNADHTNRIKSAIASGSIDTVRAEINAINAEIVAAQQAAQIQAEQQAALQQQLQQQQAAQQQATEQAVPPQQ